MNDSARISVRDVMRDNFVEIDGLTTVQEALKLMMESDAKTIIIKKRDELDEHGILLLSDIAKKVLAKDKSPERVNSYEIMSKPVLSVSPDMDVRYCARLFNNFGIAIAPVIEDGKVIGVVGYHELVLKGLVPSL